MKTGLIAAISAFCLIAAGTQAADQIKIGYITTLSGPGGALGKHMKDAADLALEKLGGKLGGIPTEIIYGDDQLKPDVGRQVAEEMLKKDKVDFIDGVIWSNVLLAIYQPVIGSGTILLSNSAGPQEVAGAMCAPNFFTTGWQNAVPAEAMGIYMNSKKIDKVFAMAPNYTAGKDIVAGFKRTYKGQLVAEVYTRLDQTDFQTELTQMRAADPQAIFIFEPGAFGIQFFKQFDQAGLHGKIPVYSVFTTNEIILPALGDAGVGVYETGFWSPALKNPANQEFVAEFRKKYNYVPAEYAATAYDGIRLLDSAVKAVKGDLKNKKGLIAALDKANIASVRGPFKYNINHFPIQNYYLLKVAHEADGSYMREVESTILTNYGDSYYKECKMKP